MVELLSTILQLLGLLVLVVAGFILHIVLGLAILGAALILVGHLLETPMKGRVDV